MLRVKRDFLKETVYTFLSQTHKRRLTNQRDVFFLIEKGRKSQLAHNTLFLGQVT